MAKCFTLKEITYSATAERKGIDNTPPPQARANLCALMSHCLDPVRELWGKPVYVNSGYRSPVLNADPDIRGAKNSQHMYGQAADITTGGRMNNKRLFGMIEAGDIPYDQLIDENDYRWIHISYSTTGNRKQVLHK